MKCAQDYKDFVNEIHTDNFLELRNVEKFFEETGRHAVRGVSFSMEKGEIVALIGSSGCGKTTLVRSIFGLYDLTKGEIFYQGKRVLGPEHHLVPGHKEIAVIHQDYKLTHKMRVWENISLTIKNGDKQYAEELTDRLLKLCELEDYRDNFPHELSGGQKQRVSIAQALAKETPLLIMDEPFSNLDFSLKFKIKKGIYDLLKEKNRSAIFVVHDTQDALSFSDKIAVMNEGLIVQWGTPQDIYEHPNSLYVAHFFGNPNIINTEKSKSFDIITPPNHVACIREHDITINKKGKYTGKVIDKIYEGKHYIIIINYQDIKLNVQHPYFIEKGSEVNFDIDTNKTVFLNE